MGIFDIFRRKAEPAAPDDLSLETLLQKAASEPAYRAKFYKRLLSDNLFVLTKDSEFPEGEQILQKGTNVNIVSLQNGTIPVFTSIERIFDKGVINEQVEYLQMQGTRLFETAKGATFVLNPNSDFGKELLPDEIERMLSGKIFTDTHKELTLEKDTNVQIGQPSKYPNEIVASLKILFSNKPNVKAAYLGWIYNPESDDPAHYIFGLDADGDLQSLTQEAGFTAKEFLSASEFVDFIKVDNNGGLSDYFLNETEPFYRR